VVGRGSDGERQKAGRLGWSKRKVIGILGQREAALDQGRTDYTFRLLRQARERPVLQKSPVVLVFRCVTKEVGVGYPFAQNPPKETNKTVHFVHFKSCLGQVKKKVS